MKLKQLFVIPIALLATVAAFAGDEARDRGYMGVALAIVETNENGVKDGGVFIKQVMPGSAAELAGLEAEDRILALNGTTIVEPRQIHGVLNELGAGDEVLVVVDRDGAEESHTVVLGALPRADKQRWAVLLDHKGAWLGLHLQPLSRQLAGFFEVDGGLLISEVVEDGPAAEAGILAGDVIQSINDEDVESNHDLHRAMAEVEPGDSVAVSVIRRGSPMTLYVEAGEHEGPVGHNVEMHLEKLLKLGSGENEFEWVAPGSGTEDSVIKLRERILHEHKLRDEHRNRQKN